MLAELKFVLGAVNKKTVLPALTHFKIEDSTVRSFNGVLALCSPIPIDLVVAPLAVPFYNAIKLCDETVSMTVTPTKRLSIKSGSFKALIECLPDTDTPHALPEGDLNVELNGKVLIETFKLLEPLIGDDASRPWSNGVLFKDEYAYVTNNIIVVQRWIGVQFPEPLNVPEMMIREVLRIGEPPVRAQIDAGRSMTLHYENGRWIRCQLLSAQWPDLSKILDVPVALEPITEGLFKGLKKLAPFKDKFGRVYLRGNEMRTHESDNDGATVEIEGVPKKAIFNLEQLALLEGVATKIDFSAYPKPCIFHGNNLRGAIIGLRI